jgi:hypothetical protein
MGRLTPSFRTVYSEVLHDLRKEMRTLTPDGLRLNKMEKIGDPY